MENLILLSPFLAFPFAVQDMLEAKNGPQSPAMIKRDPRTIDDLRAIERQAEVVLKRQGRPPLQSCVNCLVNITALLAAS